MQYRTTTTQPLKRLPFNKLLFSGTFLCLAIAFAEQPSVMAQQDKVVPKGIGQASLKKINVKSVTDTISYLASDELEGRGTFSPGFRKAAEYAVKRFKAAGAKPGAGESFFHITKQKAIKLPSSAEVKKSLKDGGPKFLGVAAAGNESFDFNGTVPVFSSREKFTNQKLSGPIAVLWNKRSRGRGARMQLARFAGKASQAGATGIILMVSPENGLVSSSKKLQEFGDLQQGAGIPLPIAMFDATGLSKEKVAGINWKFTVPAAKKFEGELRNVLAIIPGTDPKLKDEIVLFTAHLDHLGKVGDTIYNGADDDATGCTAVITLADAYGALKTKPKRTTAFMLFWGEERGLLGSKAFAKTPSFPLKNIVCNINIEMIGRPEQGATGKVWVTGWEKSDLGSLMNEDSEPFGVKIFEHPKFSAMLYRQSDNWSFAQKGVIAHSFSAGSLHRDYHQPTDDWQLLNTKHMTEVIKGLFVGSYKISNGEKTPAAAKK